MIISYLISIPSPLDMEFEMIAIPFITSPSSTFGTTEGFDRYFSPSNPNLA